VPSLLQENGRDGRGNECYPDEDQLLACPLDIAMRPQIKIANHQQP